LPITIGSLFRRIVKVLQTQDDTSKSLSVIWEKRAEISKVGFFLNLPRPMKSKQTPPKKIGSRPKILAFAPNGKIKRFTWIS
jgi:hypothetical protein